MEFYKIMFIGREIRGRGKPIESEDKPNEEKIKTFYIPPVPSNDENDLFGQGICSGINFEKYDKIPIKVNIDILPSNYIFKNNKIFR